MADKIQVEFWSTFNKNLQLFRGREGLNSTLFEIVVSRKILRGKYWYPQRESTGIKKYDMEDLNKFHKPAKLLITYLLYRQLVQDEEENSDWSPERSAFCNTDRLDGPLTN